MSDLTVAKTIDVQEWMRAPETLAVMQALQGDDAAPQALFVGGCVRNALLGVEVQDIDIATVLMPDEVMARCASAGLKTVPTGIDHGTVTAVSAGRGFEVTTLRRDVDTDGRHAMVAFYTSWLEDAKRRDFTMNTLLADVEGRIYDPLGQGVNDLEAGRVVFVGDAAQRIKEDYLRVLRFFRFHGAYGFGEPDEDALKACAEAAEHIHNLSRERITQEFMKILMLVDAPDVCERMYGCGVLRDLFAEEGVLVELRALETLQRIYISRALSARLLVLAEFDDSFMTRFEPLLILPKVLQREMDDILNVLALPPMVDEHAVRVALYKYGRAATVQALLIGAAFGRSGAAYVGQGIEITHSWDIPVFPVTGDDLIKEGFEPGPALGEELRRREADWIANNFSFGD